MGFFDDLSKKASQTYKNTAERTNKFTREMKLKSLINDDKNKIEKIYCEIGKKIYEKHIREENIDIKSEIAEESAKIDAYCKEIEDMNTELRALKDLRLCKVCASEIPITAKFCPKCGAVQEETTADNVVEKIPEANAVENSNVEKNDATVTENNIEVPTTNEVNDNQTDGNNN